jgi:phosphonoacetaldehyde hydrolase
MTMSRASGVRLVVFDWAGTLVDCGSVAPVAAFRATFARHGVCVSDAQLRQWMGLGKRAHIEAILLVPDVAEQWHDVHGRSPSKADVDGLYRDFVPELLRILPEHSALIDGVDRAITYLRRHRIAVATTTGYFAGAAQSLCQAAKLQGFTPDHAVCSDDVAVGRPAPWMIYACMEALGVFPPEQVVVVGDTAADVWSGRNAGCFTVGVARTGNGVGLSEAQWASLGEERRQGLLAPARAELASAGADFVIDTLHELPAVIDSVARRLQERHPEPARVARKLEPRATRLRALGV